MFHDLDVGAHATGEIHVGADAKSATFAGHVQRQPGSEVAVPSDPNERIPDAGLPDEVLRTILQLDVVLEGDASHAAGDVEILVDLDAAGHMSVDDVQIDIEQRPIARRDQRGPDAVGIDAPLRLLDREARKGRAVQ